LRIDFIYSAMPVAMDKDYIIMATLIIGAANSSNSLTHFQPLAFCRYRVKE
jgi:hypothetical protein